MTDERIDIVVTDKVSPAPANKLREIASEALKADSAIDRLRTSITQLDATAVTRLANASAKLTNAQARETSAVARLTNARARSVGETNKAAISSQRLATEQARTEAATERAANAASRARSALIAEEAASTRLAAAKRREAAAQNLSTTAATRAGVASRSASRSARQATAQTQNLIFQVQDVAVGLQAGQKPLTVLLQQGTQIVGAFGPGTGVIGILGGVVRAIGAMVAPFLPVLAVVGVATGLFAILRNEVVGATDPAIFGDLQSEVDQLTKAQREGITVAITFGDVFSAAMQLAGESVYRFIEPAVTFIQPLFVAAYNGIISATKRVFNNLVSVGKAIPILFEAPLSALPDLFFLWGQRAVARLVAAIAGGLLDLGNVLDDIPLLGDAFFSAGLEATEFGNKVRFAAEDTANSVSDAAAQIDKELTAVFTTDHASGAFAAIQERSIQIARERIANEIEEERTTSAASASLTTKQTILRDILKPLTEYRESTTALNELLNEGAISIGQYNQALSSLSLVAGLRDLDASLILTPFANEAAVDEIRVAEQERLNIVQQALEARIISEQEAARRIVAINRQAAADTVAAQNASQSVLIRGAGSTFTELSSITSAFAGEQSNAYKALFAASKAFAIADSIISIQQGVAKAISLGFPQNIPVIAATVASGASVISSIQSVGQNGFMDGGYTGNGSSRDVAGVVHGREYVFDAASTARIGVNNLERMRTQPNGSGQRSTRGGSTNSAGINISINNYGSDKNFEVQQISENDVRVIATDVARTTVRDTTPSLVSGEIANPNSRVSKSLAQNTTAQRRR